MYSVHKLKPGDRIYYIDNFNLSGGGKQKIYGTFIGLGKLPGYSESKDVIWAYWRGSKDRGWMEVKKCFYKEQRLTDKVELDFNLEELV